MSGFLVVFCTCADEQEARRIAKALVEGRLAACVNVLPRVQSVYRWQGEVKLESEYLLLIKTTEERFAALRDSIAELHSYEVPELLALSVWGGSDKYLAWIQGSV
jgi:periplasmic divalent cation tolerance protein